MDSRKYYEYEFSCGHVFRTLQPAVEAFGVTYIPGYTECWSCMLQSAKEEKLKALEITRKGKKQKEEERRKEAEEKWIKDKQKEEKQKLLKEDKITQDMARLEL